MGDCSHAVYSKRRTHDYGGVRRVRQPWNVTGIGYNIDPTKLHVDPDIDVTESAVYSFTHHGGLLERDVCVIVRPCIEDLARLHAMGGDAGLHENQLPKIPLSKINYRDIAEAE